MDEEPQIKPSVWDASLFWRDGQSGIKPTVWDVSLFWRDGTLWKKPSMWDEPHSRGMENLG